MTHVAHPYIQRIGILRDWKSRWFPTTPAQYREFLRADTKLRQYLAKRLRGYYVGGVDIERNDRQMRVSIKTSRPGILIGRHGEGSQKLTRDIEKVLKDAGLSEVPEVKVDIEEIRSPESNASIVGQMIAEGLEKRLPFRRVLKQTVEKVMANRDVVGVKISISGRLGGAEMSRHEEVMRGQVPLQTLRADIDFAEEKAVLPYGVIGIKVWIYKGEVFEE